MKKTSLFIAFLLLISINDLFAQDLPNDGITSAIHKKHMSKIVFASTTAPLKFNAETESAFKSKFELGEDVYFRVYLDNSLHNYLQKLMPGKKSSEYTAAAGYKMKLYLDNVGIYFGDACAGTAGFNANDQEKMTTFKGALRNPSERGIGENAYDIFLYKAMPKLTQGDHKVKVELYPSISSPKEIIGKVIASGEFTLSVSESYANYFKLGYKNSNAMKRGTDFNGNQTALDASGRTIATYTKGFNANEIIVKDTNGNIIHSETLDYNGNTAVKTVNGTLLGTFKKDFNGKLEFVEEFK